MQTGEVVRFRIPHLLPTVVETDLVLKFFRPRNVGKRSRREDIANFDVDHDYLQKRWIINPPKSNAPYKPCTWPSDCPDHSGPNLHFPVGFVDLFLAAPISTVSNQLSLDGISAPFYPQVYYHMVSVLKGHMPRTPVRRLSRFLNIFSRPNNQPRKASRFMQAVRSMNRTGEVSVAIQNEDAAEDAVVVTSLDKLPFCCHADLILMNRDQLLTAASVLNERLPAALQIDTDRSDSYIRNSIEFIVGLRTDPPDAPTKPMTPSRTFVPSSPISPLAKRGRSQNSQLVVTTSPLYDVTEEEQDSEPSVATPYKEPPLKRRRLVQGAVFPALSGIQRRPSTVENSTPAPTRSITRSQSAHTTRSLQHSNRAARSHSQRMNPKRSIAVTPHPSLISFCTPKNIRNPQVQPSSGNTSTTSYPLAESLASNTSSPTQRIARRQCPRDSSVEREAVMVKRLQKMNIPPVESDG